jgi:hypothetical protein
MYWTHLLPGLPSPAVGCDFIRLGTLSGVAHPLQNRGFPGIGPSRDKDSKPDIREIPGGSDFFGHCLKVGRRGEKGEERLAFEELINVDLPR